MGRTVPTARAVLRPVVEGILRMSEMLPEEERRAALHILESGKRRVPEASFGGLDSQFSFLLSVLIDLERRVRQLEAARDAGERHR
ncbi:hypothetical protein GCM10007108_02150 [Thermogymnomonas acidicola]|uniref:Uncharacterized protein n=1 Tax=Thermogymnomonas acidicola TaxID=399579 RepID=A0AA37BPY1_9ARCH|nr:hypothetical protein [Thermogymnomonas acidicola]GGM67685.1 hypothetical protein GCM10007108_02150 [Thermogymnomonas acidicola]